MTVRVVQKMIFWQKMKRPLQQKKRRRKKKNFLAKVTVVQSTAEREKRVQRRGKPEAGGETKDQSEEAPDT